MTREEQITRLLHQEAIRATVLSERAARDARNWDLMAESYTPDCRVAVSWFRGTGAEFVEASRRRIARTRSFHYAWPARVTIVGDRALAESPLEIHVQFSLGEDIIEVVSHSRMVNRMLLSPDGWKMASLDVIYRTDEARSVDPAKSVPVRWNEIADYRSSYRMMMWMVASTGLPTDDSLLGDDRPDALAEFFDAETRWLNEAV